MPAPIPSLEQAVPAPPLGVGASHLADAGEPIDLRKPVWASIEALLTASAAKGVRIEVELPAEPVIVNGDPEALQQAVTNLVDNAIKHSQGKTVHVRVLANTSEAMLEGVGVGVGVEPRHQERVFERFYRIDKVRANSAAPVRGSPSSSTSRSAPTAGSPSTRGDSQKTRRFLYASYPAFVAVDLR